MEIKVLDYGYVRFIEAWGHGEAGEVFPTDDGPSGLDHNYFATSHDYECGIIEAARQSTQGSFRGWETDEKLLGFLYNNKPPHATPFEFAGMVIEVQAPIMVYREWHRHRTQSYNEMSGRYAPIPDINYVPTVERLLQVNEQTKNKQAGAVKGALTLTPERAALFQTNLKDIYTVEEEFYQTWLQGGVAKELARLPIGVGRYSRMRAQTNLRNWLAFLTLRADPQAAWEIQQFAHAVGQFIQMKFPKTWDLYHRAREAAKPENAIKAFTDEALRAEFFRRGLDLNAHG